VAEDNGQISEKNTTQYANKVALCMCGHVTTNQAAYNRTVLAALLTQTVRHVHVLSAIADNKS